MMNRSTPLWRDANRLLVEVEGAVRNFPKYYKYTIGTDLRRQAFNVCRLVGRAFNDAPNRLRHLETLVASVDDLKILIQLSKEVKALNNFHQFQVLSELSVSVGKQVGGWKKQMTQSTTQS